MTPLEELTSLRKEAAELSARIEALSKESVTVQMIHRADTLNDSGRPTEFRVYRGEDPVGVVHRHAANRFTVHPFRGKDPVTDFGSLSMAVSFLMEAAK